MKHLLKGLALAILTVLAAIAASPFILVGSGVVALVCTCYGLLAAVIALPVGLTGHNVELQFDGWLPNFRISCGGTCRCGRCSHFVA